MSEIDETATTAPQAVEEQEPDPNAPWSPEESEVTTALSAEDLEILRSQLPVVEEIIAWFDGQIALYGNPEVITGVNPSSKPEDVKNAVMFAQQMIKGYKDKRKEFAKKFEPYLTKQKDPPLV